MVVTEDVEVRIGIKEKRGKLVRVCDARKWPVVHCGNVCVCADDTSQQVTSNILNSGGVKTGWKKGRSSKYSLAIGSPFGHVHTFLSDSEGVLNVLDGDRSEDPCLMLIKKPKSAPKQMLKSHSWANLSAPDRLDGGYHGDPRKHLKYRAKRKQSDLQLGSKESSSHKLGNGTDSESDEQFGFHNKENGLYHVRGSQTLPGPRHTQMAGNVKMRNNSRMRDNRSQSLLCVNSTSEINNNKRSVLSNGHKIHQSHNDIYAEISMSSDSCDDQNTGGRIGNDELYQTEHAYHPKRQNVPATRSNSEYVSRSHSLGDLSTGLTLSLVGQRKSDSMQSLPITGASCGKPLSGYRDRHFGKLNHSQLDNISENTQVGASLHNSQKNENGSDRSFKTVNSSEKTPTRARRSLPQVPAGFDERKKKVTDLVKMRVSQHSSNSNHSPGSRQQQTPYYPNGNSARVPSPTPSECEISALLEQSGANGKIWTPPSVSQQCNNKSIQKAPDKVPVGTSEYGIVTRMARYSQGQNSANQNCTYGPHAPPGDSRISDSRQTTTTSQSSTVDSGYSTNEPETDVYSTSWYTRSLQRSAQNLYSTRNKLYSKAGSGNHGNTEKINSRSNTCNPPKPLPKPKPPQNSVYSVVNKTYTETDNETSTQSRSANFNVRDEKPYETKVLSPNLSQTGYQHLSANTIKPVACKAQSHVTTNSANYLKSSTSPAQPRSSRVAVPPESLPIRKDNDSSVCKLESTLSENDRFSADRELCSINSVTDIGNMSLSPISPSTEEGNSSYSTLPGNWKFHNSKNLSSTNPEQKPPCLFQILQTFNLHPIFVNLPENLVLLDHLRLYEVPIVLPAVRKRKAESPVSSPQGRYAKLGGPGSAFKPVRTGQPNVSAVTMVTIAEVSHQLLESCEQGQITKGDLIIEINECLVLDNSIAAIKATLQQCRGSVCLTVARNKCPPSNNNQETSSSNVASVQEVQDLQKQVAKLILEIEQKDKVLQELNTMVPWKQLSDQTLPNYTDLNSNSYVPDAFINGLSEDEFIV